MDDQEFVMNYINAQLQLIDIMRVAADPFPSPEADALEQELMDIVEIWEGQVVYLDMTRVLPLAQAWQESWYGRF